MAGSFRQNRLSYICMQCMHALHGFCASFACWRSMPSPQSGENFEETNSGNIWGWPRAAQGPLAVARYNVTQCSIDKESKRTQFQLRPASEFMIGAVLGCSSMSAPSTLLQSRPPPLVAKPWTPRTTQRHIKQGYLCVAAAGASQPTRAVVLGAGMAGLSCAQAGDNTFRNLGLFEARLDSYSSSPICVRC